MNVVHNTTPYGLRELALFAGAGGGILGGMLLGWRTVCAVEINDYARKVLLARQRNRILRPFPIWDDVRTFDGTQWRGKVDVITGGFPCQDISIAGDGKGIDRGEKSGLWREYARIICEVRPHYVFVENSPMLTSRGLGRVLGDLAEAGYDAAWCVLSAEDCGAPHKRSRMWILGTLPDTDGVRQLQQERSVENIGGWLGNICEKSPAQYYRSRWWDFEPQLGRMADGVGHRMDRLKALGNGQVPFVACSAFMRLYEALMNRKEVSNG